MPVGLLRCREVAIINRELAVVLRERGESLAGKRAIDNP
jgi:hypothetical protein